MCGYMDTNMCDVSGYMNTNMWLRGHCISTSLPHLRPVCACSPGRIWLSNSCSSIWLSDSCPSIWLSNSCPKYGSEWTQYAKCMANTSHGPISEILNYQAKRAPNLSLFRNKLWKQIWHSSSICGSGNFIDAFDKDHADMNHSIGN